jgi:hypothetical protein
MTDLHALALQLAPELVAADLRIIEHQPHWPKPAVAVAYAIYGKHLPIRQYLASRGEWSGRWGSFIVSCEPLTIATLLHELAHVLPAREPLIDDGDEPTPEQVGFQSGQLKAWSVGYSDAPPWRGHDLKFIRRAIHLHYRASQCGVNVSLNDFPVAGPCYGLSMPEEYRVELATEPQRMTKKSFAEIDAEPMPPRFAKLFANDAGRYCFDYYVDQYVQENEESCDDRN